MVAAQHVGKLDDRRVPQKGTNLLISDAGRGHLDAGIHSGVLMASSLQVPAPLALFFDCLACVTLILLICTQLARDKAGKVALARESRCTHILVHIPRGRLKVVCMDCRFARVPFDGIPSMRKSGVCLQ